MKVRPLADRILLKRMKQEETSYGGILLPETAKQKQEMGEVIAVGPGKKDRDGKMVEITVKAGDKVLWDKYSAQEISVEEEEFVIVKADDLIAIIQ
ncbi:MAG: co-chaperone GroES [Verrucomicrobia bacterium]|nr:co-chaperone GroES [Verrucomicrobiota bacterium]